MKYFRFFLLVLTSLLFLVSCLERTAQRSIDETDYPVNTIYDSISRIIMPLIDYSFWEVDKGMLAMAVYLQKGEDVLLDTSFYFSNGKNPLPDERTIFQMGSVTKTFTAAMVARQVNNGNMRLNDLAQSYLPVTGNNYPELPSTYNGEPVGITLGELATMNSGLPRNVPPETSSGSTPYLYAFDWIDSNEPLVYKPGSQCYLYSNLGFGILGLTLSAQAYPNVSDYYNKYEYVVVDSLLKFLGMNDTRITLDSSQLNRRALPYNCEGIRSKYNNPNWPMNNAAGALYSTIYDMNLYAREMIGEGSFLTQQDLDTLFKARIERWPTRCKRENESPIDSQAMAWVITEDIVNKEGNKFTRISKDGGLAGFSAYITLSTPIIDEVQYKAYVVLWVNQSGFHVQPLSRNIMQMVYYNLD